MRRGGKAQKGLQHQIQLGLNPALGMLNLISSLTNNMPTWRVSTGLENLEVSLNLKAVRVSLENWLKLREMSGTH